MYLPNYHDGSIVNLMSSILSALGGASQYTHLPSLPPSALSKIKNIVLLIVDGLGYEYLAVRGQNTIFHQYLKDKLTSVFPSTTAAGITTFLSGLAPQQHAMTGWFMHLKEFGAVSTSLRFRPRCCEMPFSMKNGAKPEALLNYPTIFEQIKRQSYSVTHKSLIKSEYNSVINKHVRPLYYTTFSGCLRQIKRILTSNHEKKFIYAYWPDFDGLCHKHGTKSAEVAAHFVELTKKITALIRSLANSQTTFIITSDHGLIDTEASKIIEVRKHPDLEGSLILPLCGEPRVAYCYVRPSRTAQFEAYIKQHFSGMCEIYTGEELINNCYFGLFEPNKRLFDRVGDYVLIMRDNYVIKDFLLGEEEKFNIGYHGGVSKEEMFVPLVVINV